MMRAANRLAVLALALLLGSCGARQVGYFDGVAAAARPNVTRLYFDRQGSLYPEAALASLAIPPIDWDGSLFGHFVARKPCRPLPLDRNLADLCDASGAPPAERRPRWFTVQERMLLERGNAIADNATGAEPVFIFLVHGFNNSQAEAGPNFAIVREQLTNAAPEADRAALNFVEVYWDGCSHGFGPPCWPKAQWSGPLAGLALRDIFSAIDQRLGERPSRMRAVTHSSGAFVMAAALGNPDEVLPQLIKQESDEYRRFARLASERIVSLDEIRVAMFAPATTPLIFSGKGGKTGLLTPGVTLLFTVHPDDEVLIKKKIIRLGCRGFGVTCLGADRAAACTLVESESLPSKGALAMAYDFARVSPRHDFAAYLEQAAEGRTTIWRDLMASGPPIGGGAIRCP